MHLPHVHKKQTRRSWGPELGTKRAEDERLSFFTAELQLAERLQLYD